MDDELIKLTNTHKHNDSNKNEKTKHIKSFGIAEYIYVYIYIFPLKRVITKIMNNFKSCISEREGK